MINLVLIGIAMYPIIVTIASVLAPDYYSHIGNTVSDLGSQGFPRAWIMRTGFVLLGLSSCALGFLIGNSVENRILKIMSVLALVMYGIAILLSGIYSAKAIGEEEENLESIIHSNCAKIAGMAFMISIVLFSIGLQDKIIVMASVAAFVLIGAFSVLFFKYEIYQGIWQRGLQAVSIGWMIIVPVLLNHREDLTSC